MILDRLLLRFWRAFEEMAYRRMRKRWPDETYLDRVAFRQGYAPRAKEFERRFGEKRYVLDEAHRALIDTEG
jgi:hypothetical protein